MACGLSPGCAGSCLQRRGPTTAADERVGPPFSAGQRQAALHQSHGEKHNIYMHITFGRTGSCLQALSEHGLSPLQMYLPRVSFLLCVCPHSSSTTHAPFSFPFPFLSQRIFLSFSPFTLGLFSIWAGVAVCLPGLIEQRWGQ